MKTPSNWLLSNFLDNEWCENQWLLHLPWLKELDANLSLIPNNLTDNSGRLLGKYVEDLVFFWLQHSPWYQLLHTNIQLVSKGITIGEADCLVRDLSSGQLLHLELACKYFLGRGKSSHWSKWIGPNSRDSLSERMDSFHKQSALFHTQEGKRFLEEKNLEMPLSVVLFKGYFMQHFSRLGASQMPQESNNACNGGWYIKVSELEMLATDFVQWVVLSRTQWLSPLHASLREVRVLSGFELMHDARQRFQSSPFALLIAQVKISNGWVDEMSRGFIVHDGWR